MESLNKEQSGPSKAESFIIRLKARLGQTEKSEIKHVGVVAVMNGDKILMGKRQDNGKWTNPGGHLEGKEDPKEGALRELKEEAGLDHDDAKKMVTKKVTTPEGKKLVIHAYKVEHDGQKPNSKNDPDEEVKKWEWIDTKNMPKKVLNNLHSPKNVILQKFGILKSLFNLEKSQPHKYIRKYKRGANWIYVYHEADNPPRQIPEEAINRLKELADAGDEKAKELYESIGEYSPVKLQLLRELASAGDQEAKRHLKENHAIDFDQEKLEDEITKPAADKDLTEKELSSEQKTKVKRALINPMSNTLVYLTNHRTSPFVTSLSSIGGLDNLMDRVGREIESASTIKEALQKLHTIASDMDRVQPSASTSSNSTIKNGGGYGSVLYNDFVKELETKGLLPEGYSEIHKRVANQASHEVPKAKDLAEKAARMRVEREERERRELAEIHGSMAHYMTTLMSGVSSSDRIEKARALDRQIRMIFGKSLKKEDWPYNFEAHNLKTEIKSVNITGEGFELNMQVKDAQGNHMMESWTRRFSRQDGRPHIYNAYMKVKKDARGSVQIGSLINQGQRKLMKSLPDGGTVGVTANIDVGGYNWANQGFSFKNPSDLFVFKRDFQNFLNSKGIHLTDADMAKFKEPFHIAAFTDGKKYVRSVDMSMKLSDAQKQSRSLTGVEGEHPLTDSEIRSGETTRMAMNLGKMFMLGKSWGGIWDSKKETEASKFADKYYEMRERAVEQADHAYKNLLSSVKSGERGQAQVQPSQPQAAPRTITESNQRRQGEYAQRMIDRWRRGSDNLRMTQARMTSVARLSDEGFNHFMIHAPMTRAARIRLRAVREEFLRRQGGTTR